MDKRSVVVSVFVAVFLFAETAFAQGLLTPEPTGYRTIATFTGAYADFGNGIATNVHCSSGDTTPLNVLVQFFQLGGDLAGEGELTILPGHTVTVSTRSNLYPSSLFVSVGMNGGPIRVLSNGPRRRLACTAYVLNASTTPGPLFVIPLPALDH